MVLFLALGIKVEDPGVKNKRNNGFILPVSAKEYGQFTGL